MTAAERVRRSRELQRAGAHHVSFVLAHDARMRLVEAGWLRRADRDDKAAIITAVIRCLDQALGMQKGEDEVSIDKAAAGRAEAAPAREEGTRQPMGRERREAIPPPSQRPDKAAALRAYRELLCGAELPGDLVAAATAADLEAARASILEFVAAAERGESPDWHQYLSRWRLVQNFPDRLAAEYGVPFLQLAIGNRQRAEAKAAHAARRAKGLTIALPLPDAATLRELREREFLAADAKRGDKVLSAAILRAIEFALSLPAGARPAAESGQFAGPKARRNAMPRSVAAQPSRTLALHLPGDVAPRLVDRFAPMANPEDGAAVARCVRQAMALALNPPPLPRPVATAHDLFLASLSPYAFQRIMS